MPGLAGTLLERFQRGERVGELRLKLGQLLGRMARFRMCVYGGVMLLLRLPGRLGTLRDRSRLVKLDVQVGIGEERGDGLGLSLVARDALGRLPPPGSVPERRAGRLDGILPAASVRGSISDISDPEAGAERRADGAVSRITRVGGRSGGLIRGVRGGGERLGAAMSGIDGGRQVRRAAELSAQFRAAVAGALDGGRRLGQRGRALLRELHQPGFPRRDFLVQGVEPALEVAEGGGGLGELGGAGFELAGVVLGLAGGRGEVSGVVGHGEARIGQALGELASHRVGGGDLQARFVRRLAGLVGGRVRPILLRAADRVPGQLAELGVVERAADRARGAVDERGGQFGAHAVDTRLANPQHLVSQCEGLLACCQVCPMQALALGALPDQSGRVCRHATGGVRRDLRGR